MAHFLVRHGLNPNKVAKFGVTFTQTTPKSNEGESVWLVEVATSELNPLGSVIRPVFINNVTERTLDEEISKAIAFLASQINWEPINDDTRGPLLDYIYPHQYEIKIDDHVEIGIYELLPSSGIDKDSIVLEINGFDVTNELEITGDPYRYKVKWAPFLRVYQEE